MEKYVLLVYSLGVGYQYCGDFETMDLAKKEVECYSYVDYTISEVIIDKTE